MFIDLHIFLEVVSGLHKSINYRDTVLKSGFLKVLKYFFCCVVSDLYGFMLNF